MKPRFLHAFMPLAALLAAPLAHAQLTWDANGTTAGQTNGAGAWLGFNLWWNETANQDWVSGSNAIFGGPNTAGGAVTLASTTAIGSITFNPSFTGTYTLGTAGQTITLNNGITKNASSGLVTIVSPITLGGSQTWTNNSTNKLQISSFLTTSLGQTLTLAGTGEFNFPTTTTGITGDGSIIVDGTYLSLISGGNQAVNSYTGTTTVQNGGEILYYQNGPNIGTGNITLNGGLLAGYYNQGFTRAFGTGSNQFQITGGVSGFGVNGSNTINFSNVTSVQWGSASFNPSKFVLGGGRSGGTVTFAENIDLNNADRTVTTPVGGVLSGALSTSSGTAGLIKEGAGTLTLSNTNTYNGNTAVNEGALTANTSGALPGFATAGKVTVAAGATLAVRTAGWTVANIDSLRGAATWSATSSQLGFDTSGGSFAYVSDITEALSVAKLGANTLTLTGNNSYSGRTGVQNGTLSFNSIGNVSGGSTSLGAPTTAANGTIHIGSGGTAATITYTGSGHSTDRVINLSGSTGGASIDASGAGPLTLTSSLTAAAGAKTLTLTGSNTAANTLGTTAIPGLSDILTITKSGAGTWRINGFSSPKNAWSVTAGTLLVAGGITTGDQQVTVSGGTLAGVGPITMQSGKILAVQAAGSLAPGNQGVGTMAVTGVLNISAMAGGTGKLNFEMAAPNASDRIAVTGTAQIGTGQLGLNDFVFTDLGGMTANTYVLISTTGGITGTLDPANRLGSIGSISGALQINGNNIEFTVDSDLDGIPDSYELANTVPPSATALDPNADTENGGTGDGLTNLQEYIIGTNPNLFDTDADGIRDGYETNTGTWVSSTSTGTNPLVLDTDGDTIRDGYETKTGIYVSSTDTGTNPNLADTDADALTDNVETNTGTNVSKTNTGTNPNNPDTDADGAGDWYEVTASLTNPFSAANKPNVPYPLPDPDSSTGATDKPVKVYIMSGQSNMVGAGTVSGTGDGTLETMTLRQNKFPNLVTQSGAWTAREDVYYRGVISATADKKLGPGCGSGSGTIGPELGFGHVMGWFHDEGVLLLKSSIGNRALGWDILPAGSARYEFGGFTYCGSGDAAERWAVGSPAPTWTTGNWYAGYEWDRFFRDESEWIRPHAAEVNVVDILDNWTTQHYGAAGKHYAGRDFQIAGFVWWQGERDSGDAGHSSRYEQNLVHLINSLRSYYSNRYPGKVVANAPFVMATLGETSDTEGASNSKTVFDAMMNVGSGNYPNLPRVKTVYSYPLSEGGSGNGHYNNRAGTYMIVGDAMGRAMIDLQSATTGNTFANWMAGFPSVAPGLAGFNQDADGDGIDNGAENFFGTNPGIGSSGLVSGASSGNTFVFTHPQNATPATGVSAAYRWSKDLTTFRNDGQTDGDGTTVNFSTVTNAGVTTVTATVTGTPAAKLFVDVNVLQN